MNFNLDLCFNIINTLLFVCIYAWFIRSVLRKIFQTESKKQTNTTIPITPEEKESDMSLIYEALDMYILKELHNFSTRDYSFDDGSDIKLLPQNNYRLLIKCLLSPNQHISIKYPDGEEKKLFFSMFINRIYLNYISETSNNIKSLLFKYYSGYTKDNYFNKKKSEASEPSALPFITNYVRNYLWCRYEENENSELQILETIRSGNTTLGADSYESAMKAYDMACCRKLTLNIYHSNDIVEISTNKPVTKTERNKNVVPKTISEFGLKTSKDQINGTKEN